MQILLIGMMGCGKSTIGEILAKKLNYDFIDMDVFIENKYNTTIEKMFEKGEEYFRDCESEISKELSIKKNLVISSGGGIIKREENIKFFNENFHIIFIDRPLQNIIKNIDFKNRPLLKNNEKMIYDLYYEREHLYNKYCDSKVNNNSTLEEVVNNIISKLNKKKVLVINGPNLNLLGIREKNIYGSKNFLDICSEIEKEANIRDIDVILFQSNIEGEIINKIHEAYYKKYDGIIINPGAYTHYSYAIHDAIKSVNIKTIEVHISNIYTREEFRHKSVIAPSCVGQICGLGWYGYILALDAIEKIMKND